MCLYLWIKFVYNFENLNACPVCQCSTPWGHTQWLHTQNHLRADSTPCYRLGWVPTTSTQALFVKWTNEQLIISQEWPIYTILNFTESIHPVTLRQAWVVNAQTPSYSRGQGRRNTSLRPAYSTYWVSVSKHKVKWGLNTVQGYSTCLASSGSLVQLPLLQNHSLNEDKHRVQLADCFPSIHEAVCFIHSTTWIRHSGTHLESQCLEIRGKRVRSLKSSSATDMEDNLKYMRLCPKKMNEWMNITLNSKKSRVGMNSGFENRGGNWDKKNLSCNRNVLLSFLWSIHFFFTQCRGCIAGRYDHSCSYLALCCLNSA